MSKIELINSTNLPESLVEAVINQFGGWDDFTESAQDVANHGIDGGFHGFIYHVDTVNFAYDNLKAILSLAKNISEDFGLDGAYSLIAGFNCLNDYTADDIADIIHMRESFDDGADFIQVFNALTWFAAEEVCRAYSDSMELAA